jgi:mannitol/fructose-specific phosphotransferase system IIA component (Ntr-type)
MRLTDLIKPINIKVPMVAASKADAIRELVDLLAINNDVTDGARVLEAVLERESTRTTGIGFGLAIPHGKTSGTDHLTMAIGKCGKPLDFQAIDGKPVTLIWMLVSPPDKAGMHIATLARISRLMTVDRVRHDLNKASTPDELLAAITSYENENA